MALGVRSCCKKCFNQSTVRTRKHWYETKGRRHYQETRKKIVSKWGIGFNTIRRYGLKESLAVFDRDKRKCVYCGTTHDLTIHHIDGNGHKNQRLGLFVNNKLENLILLCRSCHGKIHGKDSWKNRKR